MNLVKALKNQKQVKTIVYLHVGIQQFKRTLDESFV